MHAMRLLLFLTLGTALVDICGSQYIPNTDSAQGLPQLTGTWLTWSSWSTCSVSCGQGVRRRSRACRQGVCLGPSIQTQICVQLPCPVVVTPQVGTWSDWSTCSTTCGDGRIFRFRQCIGQQCPQPHFEINVCNNGPCSSQSTTTTTATSSVNHQTVPSRMSTTTPPVTPSTSSVKRNCSPLLNRALGLTDEDSCSDNPWTVHFDLYRNFRNTTFDGNLQIPFCHGVLLSERNILTTRICSLAIEAVHANGIYVVAFANSLSEGIQMRNISRAISANSSGYVDKNLAIVTVSVAFTLDACAVPACLPDVTDEFPTETNCLLTGWEPETEPGNELIVTSIQREARVTFVNTSNCQDFYAYNTGSNVTIFNDTVCSLPVQRSRPCQISNGWMLVCGDNANRPTLVGISSGSPCNPSLPSTFQGIQPHSQWINTMLQDLK